MKAVRTYGIGNALDFLAYTTSKNPAYQMGDEVYVYDNEFPTASISTWTGHPTTRTTAMRYVYAYTTGVLYLGSPYMLNDSYVEGQELTAVAIQASTSSNQLLRIGVPQTTSISGAGYCWLADKGLALVNLSAATTAGTITVQAAGTGFVIVVAGTTSCTLTGVGSVAVATTGAGTYVANLFGRLIATS